MSQIIRAFEKEVNLTEQGLNDLSEQKKGLVIDVSTKSGFTLARKERTERNKLIEQVKRAAIDTKATIEIRRQEITSTITDIFQPIVDQFESEDLRQKQEKERLAKEEEARVAGIRTEMQGIRSFAYSLTGKTSEELSGIIEAVDMIDIAESFAEFTQEAMLIKKETLSELNLALSGAIQSEQLAVDRKALDDEKAEFAAWKKSQQPKAPEKTEEVIQKEDPKERTRVMGGYTTKTEFTPHQKMTKQVRFWLNEYHSQLTGSAFSDLENILNQYK